MNTNAYTVFEVVNPVRREIYVGATRRPIFEMISILRAERPISLGAWNFDHVVACRSLEFNLSADDAHAFIESYVRRQPPKGYRYRFNGRSAEKT